MLPIEAGVMKPDPVYIRQRIPKLQNTVQEQIQLFEGQMYILESLDLQNFKSQLSIVAKQAYLHFVLLFQVLEQLRESIEAINGTADYFTQLEAQYAAEKPFGWTAYQEFLKASNLAFENQALNVWKLAMTQRGHDVTKLLGGAPVPPRPVMTAEAAPVIPKRKRNGPEPVEPPPRQDRPLDSRDFKAPTMMAVTPEIAGHIPAQAYKAPEPITLPPVTVKKALKAVKVVEPEPVTEAPKKVVKRSARTKKVVGPEASEEVVETPPSDPVPLMTPAQIKRAELMAQLQELEEEEANAPESVKVAQAVRRRGKTEL